MTFSTKKLGYLSKLSSGNVKVPNLEEATLLIGQIKRSLELDWSIDKHCHENSSHIPKEKRNDITTFDWSFKSLEPEINQMKALLLLESHRDINKGLIHTIYHQQYK